MVALVEVHQEGVPRPFRRLELPKPSHSRMFRAASQAWQGAHSQQLEQESPREIKCRTSGSMHDCRVYRVVSWEGTRF